MTEQNQKQLGTTLWAIADQLRGAMDADDFRDYMLVFIFLRYLSDNYETAAQKELGSDYPIKTTPAPPEEGNNPKNSPPEEGWQGWSLRRFNYGMTKIQTTSPILKNRCAAKCIM